MAVNFQTLPNNIKIRLFILFIQNTATTSVFPFMTLLLSNLLGAKKAGIILIIGIILKLFSSITGGHISDTLKIKKFFISSITILSSMMFLGMGICLIYIDKSKTTLLIVFIFLYLANEIFNSINKPIYNALALDSVTESNREVYSKMKYWISNVSIALGMALGGLFYVSYKVELFLFITVALIINTIILVVFIKEEPKANYKKDRNFFLHLFENYKTASKNTPFVLLLLSGILILSAEMSLSSYISVRLGKDFNTITFNAFTIDGVRMFSILMIINTVTIALFSFVILKFFAKMNSYSILKFAFLFFTCGYTVIMSNNTFIILIIFMFIATIGEILFSPTYEVEKIKLIPTNQRGSHSALDGLVITCSELLSRIFLIIGTFVLPIVMSCIIFLFTSVGFLILLFIVKKQNFNYKIE